MCLLCCVTSWIILGSLGIRTVTIPEGEAEGRGGEGRANIGEEGHEGGGERGLVSC